MGAKSGEWRSYGGDLGHTRYSPLDQINATNFNDLQIAWHFKTDSLGPRPEYQFEGTPLMIHGVVYTAAGSRRAVVALDGATGEMLWMHSEDEGARGSAAPRQLTECRTRPGVRDHSLAELFPPPRVKNYAESARAVAFAPSSRSFEPRRDDSGPKMQGR